jgi:hypothetical protein
MNESMKVQPRHLERGAYLYIRQSSMRQVIENVECGFRRSRPGIPNVFRAPFQSDAAHQSNLMAPRMVSSRRPVPVMS